MKGLELHPPHQSPEGRETNPSSIDSTTEPDAESAIWIQFAQSTTVDTFCQSWLAIVCRLIPDVSGAVVLLGQSTSAPFTPKAVWPHLKADISRLVPIAQRALTERRGLLVPTEHSNQKCYEVAYPLEIEKHLHGVVVLEVSHRPHLQLQQVRRQLFWASAWFEVLLNRDTLKQLASTKDRFQTVLEFMGSLATHDTFHKAGTAFVTELATRLNCDRVSLGFIRRKRNRVQALSHTAKLEKETNLLHAISHAMDESVDQESVIVYPVHAEKDLSISRAHEELAKTSGSGAICSLPLWAGGHIVGALTLERPADAPFDQQTREICEATADLAGPLLEAFRKDDRWLITKVGDSALTQLTHLFGPRHTVLKLCTVLLTSLCVFFATVDGDYRISAEALLEPAVLRAVVAPFQGYIAEAPIRAGDSVHQGDILCRLDDHELRLERLKWQSNLEEHQKKFHQAMAEHDVSQAAILTAQIDQSKMQLALLDDHLNRTQLTSPLDGIVVTGDLSQQLGAPVDIGKVLFEIAPLDAYRLIMKVDERDIREIDVGQTGTLLLSSLPRTTIPFTVKTVTPVSTAEEGRNYFRVEAQLDQSSNRLRPSMEGVAKVTIDRRLLIWIWTHHIIDWFRLATWKWIP